MKQPASRIYYSAKTGGFYSSSLHGDAIPADAVRITEPFYSRLLAAQAEGKVIVALKGRPRAIVPQEDIAGRTATQRERRNRLLRDSDWTQMPDSPLSAAQRASWARYRSQLRTLDPTRKIGPERWPTPPGED